jgi:hypothetical protein
MMTTVASSERRDATTRPAVPPPMTVNVSKVRMEMEISVVTHYRRGLYFGEWEYQVKVYVPT